MFCNSNIFSELKVENVSKTLTTFHYSVFVIHAYRPLYQPYFGVSFLWKLNHDSNMEHLTNLCSFVDNTVICFCNSRQTKKSSTCAVVSFRRQYFTSGNSFSSLPEQTMTLQGVLDPKTKLPEAPGSNNCNNHPTELSIFWGGSGFTAAFKLKL